MDLDRRLLASYVLPLLAVAALVLASAAAGHDPDLTDAALIVVACWVGTTVGGIRRHRTARRG